MINAGAQQLKALTACFSRAVVGIGSTAAKVRTTTHNGTGFNYSIDGMMYYLISTDDFWTMSGDTVSDDSECIFLLCINAAGTMSVVQGDAILTADLTSGKEVLTWPVPGDDVCPVGAVRVTTDGATYIPGTTSLAAGTVTDTYYNFSVLPSAPLTS